MWRHVLSFFGRHIQYIYIHIHVHARGEANTSRAQTKKLGTRVHAQRAARGGGLNAKEEEESSSADFLPWTRWDKGLLIDGGNFGISEISYGQISQN